MDVFLLGAGRPARGNKPSALKSIARNTRAMDWQLHSFEDVAAIEDIHYLGGYHVNQVIENYPQLNFTVIPDWDSRSVLHTFLKSPFSKKPVITAYSDTVFRKEIVQEMLRVDADIVYGVDSLWKERFDSRSSEDVECAETVQLKVAQGSNDIAEFTGLVHFNAKAVGYLVGLDETDVGTNLVDLVDYLEAQGLSVMPFDVSGHWAEFNSPHDVAKFILGTKAETLARLEPLVSLSHIGKQICFTCEQWAQNTDAILKRITECFSGARLVVRSSSRLEDNWHSSNAGGFVSFLDVDGSDSGSLSDAIQDVILSYGNGDTGKDQILVQEFLQDVHAAGVVFTCSLETGAPYYRFNFDDQSSSTESVTAGAQGDLRTIIASHFASDELAEVEPKLVPVLSAVQELEKLLGFDKLDIEFAIDTEGLVHIFQVRPIVVDHSDYESEHEHVENSIACDTAHFVSQQSSSPFVYGEITIFANMPDWNPAEIIGARPKPLAFSLYRHLITNDVWAQQRAEFGYRDIRPCPLIHSFSGQPYVDTRASLNSFIPAEINEDTARRLANAYIAILSENPLLHDKIEFDIAFTIWTPTFDSTATARLRHHGVTSDDILQLGEALKTITRNALTRLNSDIEPLRHLTRRRLAILSDNQSRAGKIYSLLDDCRKFGTLPFSHAARAGFVATTLLNSFVETGFLSEARRLAFLRSFDTVAGEFEQARRDFQKGTTSLKQVLEEYGHLRPGTYELDAPAYWEDPSKYIVPPKGDNTKAANIFTFTEIEKQCFGEFLMQIDSVFSVNQFIDYLICAIRGREKSKFEFSRNLSSALDICVGLGEEMGLSRGDCSYLEYTDIEDRKLNIISVGALRKHIAARKKSYAITNLVELPNLIRGVGDFYCFERHSSQPNYITNEVVDACVHVLESGEPIELSGKIVMISQADPGYDWLFSHGISGLLTQYGGANSHMAIRAAEMGLPAAIGIGEKLYEKYSNSNHIVLDCANQTIREVH